MAILTRSHQWICLLVFSMVIWVHSIGLVVSVVLIPTTIMKSAVEEGAVCLDGSPPAYNWDKGTGEGARNWLLHLQGGGWCLNSTAYNTSDYSVQDCTSRTYGYIGSSKKMPAADELKGMLSGDPKVNAFYNWNRVLVRYCDGGSFAGDAENPDPVTKHYYRGARIFNAIVNELLAKGMKDAQNVLLSGGSAGGIGSMIHCDRFRAHFPENVRVKCHADSSLFLRVKNPEQAEFFTNVFRIVVDVHQPGKALPAECTSKMSPYDCFFPQSLVQYIKSPFYFLNSAFDSFQITNTFSKKLHDDIMNHTIAPSDMLMLKDFRQQTLDALPKSSDKGYLITDIFQHTFTGKGLKKPMFGDRKSATFESALVDWFFDRRPVKIICKNEIPAYRQDF